MAELAGEKHISSLIDNKHIDGATSKIAGL